MTLKKLDHIVYLSLGFSLICLTNCSDKATVSSLPYDIPEKFSVSGEDSISVKWWTEFQDPSLNILVDQALDSNLNLKSIWQRFQVARAVVDREGSFLIPDVDAGAQSALNFPQPDFVGGENIQIGISARYEIDLWGRIKARVEAEEYRAKATYFDYQAAQISLTAQITRVWYQLVSAKIQLSLIQQQISTNEKILRLVKARFGSGQIQGVDILRQQQLIEATREEKFAIQSTYEVLQNQLAILLGTPPQQPLLVEPDSLPELPKIPDTGIPLELIQRRPDLQSLFSLVLAADREVASAISAKYPRLSFRSSAQLRSNNFQNLLRDWAYTIAGNLTAPIFYGGRLNAEVDRSEAFKKQVFLEYGNATLNALREVEDALVQEENQISRVNLIEQQVELNQKTYEQLQIQYFNGMADYLAVLTALTQQQQLCRRLISAYYNLLDFRIGLYRALAGGIPENNNTTL